MARYSSELDLINLTATIHTKPRSREFIGETYHNPDLFYYQRKLWTLVLSLSQIHQTIKDRISLLLPKTPVQTDLHRQLYKDYDCTGFALFVLGKTFLNGLTFHFLNDEMIISPDAREPWKNQTFWRTTQLESEGLRFVLQPTNTDTQLAILTQQDLHFQYLHPVHFSIYLGNIHGVPYVAHKPNAQFLPEIVPMAESIKPYKTADERLNKDLHVEYWQQPQVE